MTRMAHDLVHPPKARPGEHIAVLSPSFGAAGAYPAVHEQTMRRLTEVTGLISVEYPTTRMVGACPLARAADINAAFADPAIRGILAVVGGEDQITAVPHLDAGLARAHPKPFVGMSDNTNLHHWLWANGIASFYGGSSQVHLGPGPGVDDVHALGGAAEEGAIRLEANEHEGRNCRRSMRISASLARSDRASKASQPNTRSTPR